MSNKIRSSPPNPRRVIEAKASMKIGLIQTGSVSGQVRGEKEEF